MTGCPEYNSPACGNFPNGRTQWAELTVAHSGFTTAWSPNKVTPGLGGTFPDADILSVRERFGGPTFAAVTSRSYHTNGVNATLADGSARFIRSSVSGWTWRALGSVAGGEVTDGTD